MALPSMFMIVVLLTCPALCTLALAWIYVSKLVVGPNQTTVSALVKVTPCDAYLKTH